MILWHNPRCSKSRETLALLVARGHDPAIRLYLEIPPDLSELRDLMGRLGRPARDLARTAEADFRELGLADADDATILAALAAHPHLIERPVLIHGHKAAIGRPPQAVLSIL